MAVHNDPMLYRGGAVQLNSQPEVNLYGQLMARKQAKNDAIDEYYRKLPSTLNSEGMRDQDRAGFDQKVAEWQQHWMKNKDKIRKGNTQEAFDNEQLFRNIQSGLNQSKTDAKTDLQLGKMRFNKDSSYIFDDPEFMKEHDLHNKPVWDTDHKSIDLGTMAIPQKPLDSADMDKVWGYATKGIKTNGKIYDESKQRTDPVTGQVFVPYSIGNNQEQIKGIAENYGQMAKSDKRVNTHYNTLLNNIDEETFNKYQQAYSSVYKPLTVNGPKGKMVIPDVIDSAEKLAKADAIARASIPQTGEEQRPDIQARNAFALNKMFTNDQLIRNRMKLGSLLGLNAWKDKYSFDSEAKNLGVNKNDLTARETIEGSISPDGSLKMPADALGLPNFAINIRIDPKTKDIIYDENGGTKDKRVTMAATEKYVSNKYDLRLVPQVPKVPSGNSGGNKRPPLDSFIKKNN